MKYTVILTKQKEGGYTAQCLEIPGAITQGDTKEEAVKNSKEAISLVLEVMKEEAQKISKRIEEVQVQVK